MSKSNFQPPKGFRDFLPHQMAIRNHVVKLFTQVFESFGFQPLQTPTLEYAEVLMGKYGDEADKLLYLFEDRGGRKVGLNYDLTVPTARVLSQYQDLPKPFKRYQIQPSYRAENTQRGRYRQFTQCDIDILGSDSPLADAEILAVIYTALKSLSLDNFTIFINSRPVLYKIMDKIGVPSDKWNSVLQTVDKADKLTTQDLDRELLAKGFGQAFFSQKIKDQLDQVNQNWTNHQTSGDEFLDAVFNFALEMGVKKAAIQFKPSIVRGLDYYTGPIFETVVTKPQIGSVTGGGRYDHLIKQLGGPDLPSVGTTLGLDRICDVIEELQLWPNITGNAKVLVTIFSPSLASRAIATRQALQQVGIATQLYLDLNTKLDKQMKYADKMGIPYVVIIGDEEAAKNQVILKDMASGNQDLLTLDQLINRLKQ